MLPGGSVGLAASLVCDTTIELCVEFFSGGLPASLDLSVLDVIVDIGGKVKSGSQLRPPLDICNALGTTFQTIRLV